MGAPVFSRRQAEWVECGPRRYLVAPMTGLEEADYAAELTRIGGVYPSEEQMMAAMRAAVVTLAPDNTDELLALVDRATASMDPRTGIMDAEALAQIGGIEAAVSTVPGYAALLGARVKHNRVQPLVSCRHALRGWEGDGLPDFSLDARGQVPWELVDFIPRLDRVAIANAAWRLANVTEAQAGNSARPSPSPESPTPAAVASNLKTGAGGSSRGRSGTRTRA